MEKLEEATTELRLAFVRDHRHATDEDVVARRAVVLAPLRTERPQDPWPMIEQAIDGAVAANMASDIWGSPEKADDEESTDEEPATATVSSTETLLDLLDDAEVLADPDGVSQFFGAKPVAAPGDPDARDQIVAEEARFEADRAALATINRLRTDLYRAAGDLDSAWQSWTEMRRWEADPSDDTKALEVMLSKGSRATGTRASSVEPTHRRGSSQGWLVGGAHRALPRIGLGARGGGAGTAAGGPKGQRADAEATLSAGGVGNVSPTVQAGRSMGTGVSLSLVNDRQGLGDHLFDHCDVGADTAVQPGARRCLNRVAEVGVMAPQINGFGPGIAEGGIAFRSDDPWLVDGAPIDFGVGVNRHQRRCCFTQGVRHAASGGGI